MTKEIEPGGKKAKIPNSTDIGLAADGDLNKIWEGDPDQRYRSPRERITVEEAIIAASEEQGREDIGPPSKN